MSRIASTRYGGAFQQYPFLTPDEFREVCHHLDSRYSRALLGPVRRQWRLAVCTALDTSASFDGGYTTYIQIIRPLEGELDDGNLSAVFDGFSLGGGTPDLTQTTEDKDMMDAEEADRVGVNPSPPA